MIDKVLKYIAACDKIRDPSVLTTREILLFLRSLVIVCLFVSPFTTSAGPAIGQFELKDLEIEVGAIEFQSQNAHSFGQPDRKFINDDELEFDENEYIRQRHALEIEVSLTSYMRSRVGIEFEKERFDEPESLALANSFDALKLSEAAFETILVIQPPSQRQLGFGLLTELEFAVQDGDQSKSIIFGPILQYDIDAWQVLANIYGVYHFDGEDDGKWDFSYATRLLYQQSKHWGFGVEAYGTIDRLGNSGHLSEASLLFGDHDQHRLGPIIYYTIDTEWNPKELFNATQRTDENDQQGASLNIGIGWFFGLNDDTPDHTLKWSIEYEF